MSFTLGRTRLTLDFGFAAMLTLYALVSGGEMLALSVLASVVHETGHLAALAADGGRADSVRLTARGAVITTGRPPTVLFALGGAAANFALSALTAVLIPVWQGAAAVCAVNAAMGIVSIVPARPLDGAQALGILLDACPCGGRICAAVSAVSCVMLSAAGIALLMRSQANFSLLFLALWLMAALFDKALDEAVRRG